MQGANEAYFTKVRYPAVCYEGENSTWILTVYNQNFTTDIEENAYFYFMFYLDDSIWWNEYNNTNYKIWECKRGSWITRSYGVSSWDTIQPVVHDLKIELYSYDGNSSLLQDVVQFPIKVAVHAELSNLMVFSHLVVYLLVILLLGFCMLLTGRIEISSPIRDTASIFHQKSTRMANFSTKIRRHFFLCFYLFIFASGQVFNALSYLFSFTEKLHQSLYLIIQVAYVISLILVIRRESSDFREYGYLWPEEPHKYVVVSLLLALFYSIITIFLPGFFTGYGVLPPSSHVQVLSTILLAFTISFASETIFRGYVQGKLRKISNIPIALFATSVMFALYMSPLLPFNLSNLLLEVLSSFLIGILLGILFYRTRTLLCPVIFHFVVLFLKYLTPTKAATSVYGELPSEAVALAFTLLLLSILTVKKEVADVELSDMLLET
jgi:membrane protease YdiL (CAAX protease family)